jgi:cell division protein FtsB
MRSRLIWRRPLLTLTQIIVLSLVVISLVIVLDLTRRERVGKLAGVGEETLRTELAGQSTRQIELKATLTYVNSDEYVSIYAREEGGFVLPDEQRIVPIPVEAPPVPTPVAEPTRDPAESARPWQAWWQLVTDAPFPSR